MVRVSRDKVAENRDALLDAAGRLFRQYGVDGVGVAELCKAAGITHSVLYAHFGSKEGLAAAAFRHGQRASNDRLLRASGKNPDLAALLAAYVSRRQRDNAEHCCPMLASASEAARNGEEYQLAFQQAFDELVDLIGKTGEEPAARQRDLLAAAMIGVVAVARALKPVDPLRSDALLKTAQDRLPALLQAPA